MKNNRQSVRNWALLVLSGCCVATGIWFLTHGTPVASNIDQLPPNHQPSAADVLSDQYSMSLSRGEITPSNVAPAISDSSSHQIDLGGLEGSVWSLQGLPPGITAEYCGEVSPLSNDGRFSFSEFQLAAPLIISVGGTPRWIFTPRTRFFSAELVEPLSLHAIVYFDGLPCAGARVNLRIQLPRSRAEGTKMQYGFELASGFTDSDGCYQLDAVPYYAGSNAYANLWIEAVTPQGQLQQSTIHSAYRDRASNRIERRFDFFSHVGTTKIILEYYDIKGEIVPLGETQIEWRVAGGSLSPWHTVHLDRQGAFNLPIAPSKRYECYLKTRGGMHWNSLNSTPIVLGGTHSFQLKERDVEIVLRGELAEGVSVQGALVAWPLMTPDRTLGELAATPSDVQYPEWSDLALNRATRLQYGWLGDAIGVVFRLMPGNAILDCLQVPSDGGPVVYDLQRVRTIAISAGPSVSSLSPIFYFKQNTSGVLNPVLVHSASVGDLIAMPFGEYLVYLGFPGHILSQLENFVVDELTTTYSALDEQLVNLRVDFRGRSVQGPIRGDSRTHPLYGEITSQGGLFSRELLLKQSVLTIDGSSMIPSAIGNGYDLFLGATIHTPRELSTVGVVPIPSGAVTLVLENATKEYYLSRIDGVGRHLIKTGKGASESVTFHLPAGDSYVVRNDSNSEVARFSLQSEEYITIHIADK